MCSGKTLTAHISELEASFMQLKRYQKEACARMCVCVCADLVMVLTCAAI